MPDLFWYATVLIILAMHLCGTLLLVYYKKIGRVGLCACAAVAIILILNNVSDLNRRGLIELTVGATAVLPTFLYPKKYVEYLLKDGDSDVSV